MNWRSRRMGHPYCEGSSTAKTHSYIGSIIVKHSRGNATTFSWITIGSWSMARCPHHTGKCVCDIAASPCWSPIAEKPQHVVPATWISATLPEMEQVLQCFTHQAFLATYVMSGVVCLQRIPKQIHICSLLAGLHKYDRVCYRIICMTPSSHDSMTHIERHKTHWHTVKDTWAYPTKHVYLA